jgi:hypothetical protein
MFKVRGTLGSGKAFKFDAPAATLPEAVTQLDAKLTAAALSMADVARVSFATRVAPQSELSLTDVVKRERKPKAKKK